MKNVYILWALCIVTTVAAYGKELPAKENILLAGTSKVNITPTTEPVYDSIKLNFASNKHTAIMVPVFAFGAGAENFTGIFNNTDFLGKFLACYQFKGTK